MDGSDGHTDLRMSMPDNVGAFYRSSTKSDGSALCLGNDLAPGISPSTCMSPVRCCCSSAQYQIQLLLRAHASLSCFHCC